MVGRPKTSAPPVMQSDDEIQTWNRAATAVGKGLGDGLVEALVMFGPPPHSQHGTCNSHGTCVMNESFCGRGTVFDSETKQCVINFTNSDHKIFVPENDLDLVDYVDQHGHLPTNVKFNVEPTLVKTLPTKSAYRRSPRSDQP